MAEIAGVSEQTVRNYTRRYGELLSPQARGETGARLFSDQDVQIFCSIASLSRENIPPNEILGRIKQGDVFVELANHTTPQQATQSPQSAAAANTAMLAAARDALDASNAILLIQSQMVEIKATQAVLLRAAALWGALLGSIVTLAAIAVVVWILYLLTGIL